MLVKDHQHRMEYDPLSGTVNPHPSIPGSFREKYKDKIWIYNPYTGRRRNSLDVDSDPHGFLIVVN